MKDGKLERLTIAIITIVFTLVMLVVIPIGVYRENISIKTKGDNPVKQQSVIIPVNKNEPVAKDFTTYPVSNSELNQMAVQFNNQNTETTNSTVVDQSSTNQDVVLQGLNGDLNKPISEQTADDVVGPTTNNLPAVSGIGADAKQNLNSVLKKMESLMKDF